MKGSAFILSLGLVAVTSAFPLDVRCDDAFATAISVTGNAALINSATATKSASSVAAVTKTSAVASATSTNAAAVSSSTAGSLEESASVGYATENGGTTGGAGGVQTSSS